MILNEFVHPVCPEKMPSVIMIVSPERANPRDLTAVRIASVLFPTVKSSLNDLTPYDKVKKRCVSDCCVNAKIQHAGFN